MSMSDAQPEIDRVFRNIVTPQINKAMASTLADFLLAAPGEHTANKSAVDYVTARLWLNHDDPRGETQ